MALTGFARSCAKHPGGVASIRLIERGDIVDLTYDPTQNCVTQIRASEQFAEFAFREDEATYSEESSSDGCRISVTHRLTFSLPGMDPASQKATKKVSEGARNGLIAIVTLQNGTMFLVGYSRRFGFDRPLTLSTIEASSGWSPSDSAGRTITLLSQDTDEALPFTGIIP